MKRSSLLFFAFILIQFIAPQNLFAAVTILSPQVTLVTDANNDGYINRGDTINVRCNAFFDGVIDTAWLVPPTADLSELGMPNVQLNQAGTVYSANIVLNTWNASVNYVSRNIQIYAQGDLTALVTSPNIPITLDLANANPGPITISLPVVRLGQTVTISFTDSGHQLTPSPTVATVDLSNFGGSAAAVMSGGPNFTYNFTPPAGINRAEPITVTVSDPIAWNGTNGHPPVTRTSAVNLNVDTIGPQIDLTNTRVRVRSGNNPAVPGDVLEITAAVTAYDNETVTVQSPDMTLARCDTDLTGLVNMPLTPATPGAPAQYTLEVVLQEDDFKKPNVAFTFTFTDDAGNSVPVTRYVAMDLELPNIISLTANVISNGVYSTLSSPVATISCIIEASATIPIAAGPDTITATIDLSPIGGPANYPMTFDGVDTYVCNYPVPQGSIEDTINFTFVVSARDLANNLVARTTTPAIRIDNNPPVITGAQITSTSGSLLANQPFTVQCNVSGIENGSASVDLSMLGHGANEILTHIGGGLYRRTFMLPPSTTAPSVIDDFLSFTITAFDTVNPGNLRGNDTTALTGSIKVDNEAPTILAGHYNYVHNLYPADDDGFARIGDTISFHVRVASNPVSVRINMLSLGQGNSENFIASSSPTDGLEGWYDYVLPTGLPEGLFNRQAVSFNVTATDDDGNATATQIIANIDNRPVQTTGFDVNLTYRPGRTDTDPSIVNLNKTVHLRVPILIPSPADNSVATINLSSLGGAVDQVLTYDNGSYSVTFDPAPSSYDSSGHRFEVTITDDAGNRTIAQSSMYRVDCSAPVIVTALAEQLTGGAVAIVGDQIRFRAEITGTEGVLPRINLLNIGGSAAQAMASTGGNWFEYIATIATSATPIEEIATAWEITAYDNDQNYTSGLTNTIFVDNSVPVISGGLQLTINGAPVNALSTIKVGDILEFTINITNPPLTEGPAVVDLRAVGGVASQAMLFGNASYSITFPAAEATAEYTNYRFRAYVDDKNVNRVMTQSSIVPAVDCQPVKFSGPQIAVWQDNGDNPIAGISNLNDVIIVYASASAYFDAVVSACIGSDTVNFVDFATATMNFNATRNRHEAFFTVNSPGTDGWGLLTGSTDRIYFKLTGLDDIGNLTQTAPQLATFTMRNVPPAIDVVNTHISLNPNRFREDIGGIPIYNFGNDATGDRLVASITFADGLPMHRAWLDFSELGSGTLEMTVIGNSAETSAAGVPVSRFAAQDWLQKRVYIYGMDQAGNISMASQSLWIDNVKPALTSATFDGRKLTVNISDDLFNLEYRNFEIVGSNPPPLNTPAYLKFIATPPASPVLEDLTSFEIELAADHMREMAQWASTPIYLKVAYNIATSPLTDLSGNELPLVNFFPITITDSTWREPAKIQQFTMTHSWPNTITLDLFFNKDMDQTSVIASNAVLTFANLTYDFTGVDYSSGYIFQPADAANFTWPLANHLRVVMSDSGRDWIARKLGNGSTQLRFATRSSGHIFAYDSLGKPMKHVPTSSPVIAADNRPTPGFDFSGPPAAPKLDLASRALILTANDRLLLSTSDFDVANAIDPLIGMPQPTNNNRVNSFISKAVLHDIDSGANIILQLQPLDITINNLFASQTVTLKLTDTDLLNVLNLFKNNNSPIWRMAVGAGAFTNLWGTPNTAYLPSGNPGAMEMVSPTGYAAATFAACGMSDKPPVSQKNTGELVFDIEMFPPHIDDVIIPLQPQTAPVVRILRQSDDSLIVNGTFDSYSERTVAGKLRSIYRFKNATAFPANLQRIPAKIDVTGITDIFGNTYSLVASYAYDLNTRNDSSPDGYSDTASAPIELDTQKPVVASILPDDVIGRIPAGSTFKVNFNEEMDSSVTPSLVLTSGANIMTFSFAGWTATATADFTNDSAFTAALPNGWWYYSVTGGRDSAGNTHDGTPANAFPVQVRTYAPEVSPGAITLFTEQNTISSEILTNQPWSSIVGNGIFSIQYQTPPSLYLPHFLEIFDPSTNTRLGRAIITSNVFSTNATATFSTADFTLLYPGLTGPTSYATRIIDSALNQTETISSLIYDNLAPDVTSFNLTGIGSTTATAWHYRPTSGNFTANIVTTTTDALRLAIYSATSNATTTLPLSQGFVPTTYMINTGSTLADGNYTLTVVDMAGNLGTGAASRRLVVDTAAPTVNAIIPSDAIGNSPAGATEIRVVFSEPMDASSVYEPTAQIATTGHTIPLTFTGWADPLIASTAIFVNTNPITAILATGSYTYRVTGGRDLAGNSFAGTVDGTHNVTVYSDGPFARIDNLTDQRHIYGNLNAIQTNFAFDDNGGASATLVLNYVAGPFNTPHYLYVYDNSDTLIGSFTPGILSPTNPAIAVFPDDFNVVLGADQAYKFKLLDSMGNMSGGYLPNNLRYDTTTPTVTSITTGGPGIATDTGAGLTIYYSPTLGDSVFTVVTSNVDEMRLLVTTPTATQSATLSSVTGTTHSVSFGSGLAANSVYVVGAVDTAGHLAAYSLPMITDSVNPTVVAATPVLAGGLATGTGIFDIYFSEHMNTAIAPVLELQNGPATISMNLVSWLASDTARFTNAVAIGSSFPVGSYSYIVSGARDLAGNLNTITTTGEFEVELFTTAPSFTAQLVSRQSHLFNTTDLINRPFSDAVAPGVATLTFTYSTGHPYQLPHTVYVHNNLTPAASVSRVIDSLTSEVTVDVTLLAPLSATGAYSFRVQDAIGNLSATYTIPITYDSIAPDIAVATFSNFSSVRTNPIYYNEQLHGGLSARYTTNASDPLLLVLSPITAAATATFAMNSNTTTGVSTYTIPVASAAALTEGHYWLTAADMAGNMATGAASTSLMIIDRTPPTAVATTATGLPVSSAKPGTATFTVTFNEDMSDLVMHRPQLTIATLTASIPCTFVRWTASDTAEFINTASITIDLPQGEYYAKITAWDLTGNKLDTNNAGAIQVRSRGPVIASFVTRSFQSTTASDSSEILFDQPFSMAVAPAAATMTIVLAKAPDLEPIHLHWTLNGVTMASAPLNLDLGTLTATFTWDAATGPIPLPTAATTYVMRLADGNGDLSIESYQWRVDNVAPSVQEPVISGGVINTASSTVFFNPARHTFVNFRFNAVETEIQRLRVTGAISTDTYQMGSSGTNMWSANFDGRHSRGTAPMPTMPDGRYHVDMVDRAGNVALLASGAPVLYDVVIDTVAPTVSTYSTRLAGMPVTSFAPAAGNLLIEAVSTETALSDTGIFYLEVLNNSGVVIRKLELEHIVPAISSFTAEWDGKDSNGNLVIDGNYRFRATDYAGNPAIASNNVFARTSAFKVTGITQISSTTAKLWFNHEIDAASLAGTPIVSDPALTIGNIEKSDDQAVKFSVTPAFTDEVSYTFTASPGIIRSVFGAAIAAPDNTAILIADGKGPIISGVSFAGLAGQKEFKVEFDEVYKAATAAIASNYTLTDASGTISIIQATTQADLRTVILTAATDLIENRDYQISVVGVEDGLGNLSPIPNSYAFKGRDLTPPILQVSAFSNPANENDIIVVVTSNELLKSSPTLQVAQSNAPVITTLMQPGSNPLSYMMGVHLSPSYPGNGNLIAYAEDMAGNQGTGNNTFTIAYVSSTAASKVISADSQITLNFSEESLKEDAAVKIFKHELARDKETSGMIRTSLQKELRASTGQLRASQQNQQAMVNHSELIPVSSAYEIGIAPSKIRNGYSVHMTIPETASSTDGLGLFYQSGDIWKFVSADVSKNRVIAAKAASSEIFAVMRDVMAPRINIAAESKTDEPLRTARPEFKGMIEEAGSGLDVTSVAAHINNGPAQPVYMDSQGRFSFKPTADLVNGRHELVIKASDRTGNTGIMESLRFSVALPLAIGQLMQYPNPAKRRAYIRISANSGDLNDDLVKVRIYDTAGHKVASLDGVKAVKESWGVNSRYLYDIPWDLRNDRGKNVANGVYFARIEVRDPINPSVRVKKNFKLAVLR